MSAAGHFLTPPPRRLGDLTLGDEVLVVAQVIVHDEDGLALSLKDCVTPAHVRAWTAEGQFRVELLQAGATAVRWLYWPTDEGLTWARHDGDALFAAWALIR